MMLIWAVVACFQAVPVSAQDLNWSTDVGAVGTAGDSSFDASTSAYHIKGAGVGLTGSADAFHFAYYEIVRGDGQMVVRVSNADALAQVALVIREGLDPGAASAAGVVRNGSAQFFRRAAAGDNSTTSGSAAVNVPCWLKLVRSGNTVTTFASPDGQTWTALGGGAVTLGTSTVYIGFAVSNGAPNVGGTNMASFDGIQSTFLPSEGLALWLKADAGVTQDASGRVSTWADQSGHGMDATQTTYANQPQAVAAILNGQPAIHFDGSNSYLQLPSGFNDFSQGITALVVARPSAAGSWQRFFELANGPSVDSVVFCRYGDSDQLRFECVNGNGNLAAGVNSTGGVLALNTTQLFGFSQNNASGTATLYKNGQALTTQAAGAIVNTSRASNFIARSNFNNPFLAGDIAEIVLFNRTLSDAQRQAWENYLNAKYAYAAPPPVPTQLAATALSATQIALSWNEDPSATVTGYQVERQNPDGSWSIIAILGPGTRSYIDSTVTAGVTYHYRISALNGYGSSAPSSVAAFATNPNIGPSTFPTAGMQLWLRADLGTQTDASGGVSAWTDQAGGNHVASQGNAGNRPALVAGDLNGLPALRFNGSSGSLNTDFVGSGGQGMTFFVVTKGTTYQSLLRFQPPGSGNYLVYPWSASQVFINSADGGTSAGVPCGLVSDHWNIGAVVYRSNDQVATYRNGSLVASRATSGSDLPGGLALTIGAYAGGSEYLQADVAEVLIYNRALSDTERGSVEAYLNNKYAVVAAPDAPTALAGSAISASQANLLWQVVGTGGEALGFSVERKPADGSGNYVEVAAIGGERIGSYIDEGLTAGTAYTYRVRAYNAAGYSGYSSEASVTLPAAGTVPASLPAVEALALWLRPDSGVVLGTDNLVSAWMDLSGHGNDALQPASSSRPQWVDSVINGRPVLRFDGNGDSLVTDQPVIPSNVNTTVLAVVRLPDSNTRGAFIKNGFYAGFGFGVGNGTLDGTGNVACGIYDYARWLSDGSSWGVGTVLAEMNIDAAGNPAFLRNGVALGNLGGGGPVPSTGPTFIGGYQHDAARFFRGDIAEVLMFDRVLTNAERRNWENYLNAKYNYDPVPTTPTQLVATALSGSQAALNWIDTFGNIDGYRVEQQNADGTWSVVVTLPTGTTRYTVSGLSPGTPYHFRVIATNHTGDSLAASATLTIPASVQALPASDIRLWLRADSGTVTDSSGLLSQWTDASGNGQSASQSGGNQPTVVANALNGKPAVHFDGGSSYLNLSGSLTSNLNGAEVFVILRAANPITNVQRGLWRFDDNNIAVYPWSDGNIYDTFGTNGQYGYNPGGTALDQFNLYNVSAAAAGQWTARMNGEVLRTSANNTVRFSAGAYTLGRDRDGRLFAGDIAEMILFDRALTDSERQAVEQYLAAKYALDSLPTTPTNLAARALSPSQVSLTWQYPIGASATRFTIERALAGTGNYQVLAVVNNGTSFIDNTAAPGTAYNYRVVATDLAGNVSAASNATQATAATGGAAMPVAGLRVWLESDAGTTAGSLGAWLDQSGHGNDAQQSNSSNQPTVVANTLNGQPVVHFNGNSVLQFPGNPFAGLTASEVFVVLKAANASGGAQGLWRFTDRENDFYPENNYLCATFGTQNRYAPIGALAPLDQFNVYDVSAAPNAWSARLNGQLQRSSTSNTVDFNAGAYLLGQTRDGQRWNGDMAEILIFDHALSTNERHAVEQYVAGKYALVSSPAVPPANLAARALSPTQVSLTWQYPLGNNAVRFNVERQVGTVGGYQSLGIVENATSFIDASANAGTAYTYRVEAIDFSGGVSASSNETAATTPAAGTALPVGDLCLWLKADTNTTAILGDWADQSGNGNDAQQGSPGNQPTVVANTLDGLPVVRFDGHNSVLQMPGGLFQNVASSDVFVVLKAANASGGEQGLWRFTDRENDFYPENNYLCATFGTQNRHAPLGVPVPLDQFNLYNVSAAPNAWTARLNGEVLYTSTSNTVDFNAGAYLLGQTRDGYRWSGDIAEVMVFKHALNAPERLAVEQYLAGKYALASAPAAPTGVSVQALSPTQTSVTWQYPPTSSGTYFTIERAIAGTGNYQVIAVVANATSFLDNTAVAGTAYLYRVTATDLAGDVSAASGTGQTSTPASGANLPMAGLQMWLRADAGTPAGALGAWLDQSGNGNHAQQGGPGQQPSVVPGVINGRPVVRFDGSQGQFLNLPDLFGAGAGGAATGELIVVLRNTSAAGTNNGLGQFGTTGGTLYPNGDGNLYSDFGTNAQYGEGTPAPDLRQFNIYDLSSQANLWQSWVDGVPLFQHPGSAVSFSGSPTLGFYSWYSNYYFTGDIAEVFAYNRVLAPDERQLVNAYLTQKYQLLPPPATPTDLSATQLSATENFLSWNGPVINAPVEYVILRAGSVNGPWEAIGTTFGGTYLDGTAVAGQTYYYQVYAQDAGGSSGSTAAVSVATPHANGEGVPTDGLQTWLMGDGAWASPVSNWHDYSGNGHDAAQNTSSAQQPTVLPGILNGKAVLHFDGAQGQFLNLPSAFGDTHATANELVIVLRSTAPAGTNNGLGQFGTTGGTLYPNGDGRLYSDFGTNTQYGEGVPAANLTQFNVYDLSSQPGRWQSWINEVPFFQSLNNTTSFVDNPTLGFYSWYSNYYFTGDVAEVLAYNRVLTTAERQSVHAYLTQKYQLQSAPATPTSLSATQLSATENLVSWDGILDNAPTSYIVQRSTSPNGPFTTIATVVGSGTYLDKTAIAGQNYYYRVYAQDAAGQSAATAAVATTNPQTNGQGVPTVGLQTWLMGDGAWESPVSNWHDYSGNHNDAVQNGASTQQPTVMPGVLNGKPVLHFDGSQGQYLNLPDVFSAATATAGEMVLVLRNSSASGANNGLGHFGTTGGTLYPNNDGSLYSDFGTNAQYGEGVPAGSLDRFSIYDLSSQTNLWQSWVDGVPLFQRQSNAVTFVSNPTLGFYSWYSNYYFTGDIAEVLIYNRTLTPTERQSLNSYLTQKYQLLPAPSMPTSLGVIQLGPTENLMSWTSPVGDVPTSYVVLRATGPNGPYTVIATVVGSGTYLDKTAVAGQTYYYQVYAQNAGGQSGTTAAVAAINPQSDGTGMPLAGLRLWLMGDGAWESPVSNWHDYSGLGNDAVQNANNAAQRPTVATNVVNGRPVVRFDGSQGQFLNLPDIFGVNAGGTAGELVVVLRNTSAAGTNNGLGQFGTTGGTLYPHGDGSLYSDFGTNAQYGEGVPAPDLTGFNIYDLSSQPGLWQSWMNGVPLLRRQSNTVTFVSAPTLGYYSWYSNYYFTGDVAEVLAYDRVLTPAERQSLNAYLTQKYAIQPVPATPTGLQVIALSQTQNLVSWNDPVSNDPVVYTILRATSPSGPYMAIATVVGGSGTYLDDTAVLGQTYYYEVYVQNSAGSSGTTAAATALNPQPVVQSLPTAGLQTWLMGDGAWESPVSNWHDYSGQGNDAVQNTSNAAQRPTVVTNVVNGKPVLHFDGSRGQFLNLPDVFNAATATAGELIVVLRNTAAIGTNSGLGQFGTVGGTLYPNGDGNLYSDFGTNTQYGEGVPVANEGMPAANLAQFNVYDLSSQTGLWQSWINEVPFFKSFNNTVNFISNPTLGFYSWYSNYYFTGDVAEVLVFNRVLTPTERHAITWYLAAKYLLPNYDLDGDGLTTAQKLALGLNPFNAMSSNGLWDSTNLPLGINPLATGGFIYTTPPNPNGSGNNPSPPADPNDHTPPVITLTAPANAVLLP